MRLFFCFSQIMSASKQQQRKQAYASRRAQQDKDVISRKICERFTALSAYEHAETVLWYVHCRSEVRTKDMLKQSLGQGKRCVIPYCTENELGENQLGLWLLKDLSELEIGCWNIPEPPVNRWAEVDRQVKVDELDLIMVPGVAFDRHGGRLGNGAGYYDRLLANVRPDTVLVGVCYHSQLMEQVLTEVQDIYMDIVITENRVYQGGGR
jgi:5-formyltetrahydrofolate cyclo-ligase